MSYPLRPYTGGGGIPDRNIRFPDIGELVLIRLPFDMLGPTSVISSSASIYNYHLYLVIGGRQSTGD